MMIEYKVSTQSLVDHINNAIDVDPWAKAMVEEMAKRLKEQETIIQCIKGKCRICPHCANCDVDDNGLLKEQEATIERLEHELAVTKDNLNYYINGNN